MTHWPGIPLRQQAACFLAVLVFALANPTKSVAEELRTLRINQYETPEDCIADRTTPACALATTMQSTVITAQMGPESMPILTRILGFLLSATRRPASDEVVVPAAIDYRITSFHIYGPGAEPEFLSRHPDLRSIPTGMRPAPLYEPGIAEFRVDVRYYDAHGLAWPPSDWPPPNNWQRETYWFVPETGGWQPRGSGRITPFLETAEGLNFSPCIGDPRTPLCAVETYVACRIRDDRELCEVADETYPGSYEDWSGPERFQVEAMDWIPAESPDEPPSTVSVRIREPWFESEDGEYQRGQATRYTVVKFGDRWRVTDREAISD